MVPPLTPPKPVQWTMDDGCTLRGRAWPGAPGRRPIVYLHGIQSHGGWFEWSASLLGATGRRVLLPDRRGSGLSDGARGDVLRGERWVSDVERLLQDASDADPASACDIVGLSWGGKVAMEVARRMPQRVRRVLLITPGVFARVDVSFGAKLRIAGALALDPARTFPIPLSDPALFTDNPAAQDFIVRDPLKLTSASARFLFESARFDRRLRRWPADCVSSPVTLVLAERERIIHNQYTRDWVKRVAPNARILTLPGAHTLEFEPDRERFRDVLESWRDESDNAS